MKKFLLPLLVFCSTFSLLKGQSGIIILEGNYQGKNLYVQNPFKSGGVGFCISEVKVNGNLTTDETNSSAFEIDFKPWKLNIGDKVEVKLFHGEECRPKVLNPEVLKPKSTFEIVNITADRDGNVKWTTKAESGKLAYAIEQFRWNKWVKVGEIDGAGVPAATDYAFKVVPHSGKNLVRVRQTDYSGQPRLSKPAEFLSTVVQIDFAPIKASKEINFFAKNAPDKAIDTMYEVFDQYGNIVKKGYGNKIDLTNIPKGGYFLNYDNKMGEFVKK
jgi:hypothetical protein